MPSRSFSLLAILGDAAGWRRGVHCVCRVWLLLLPGVCGALEVELDRERGPDGLAATVFGECGGRVARLEAEALRQRPLRLGFLKTNLVLVPMLQGVRLRLDSPKGLEQLERLFAQAGWGDRVFFTNIEILTDGYRLIADEAEWRAGGLVLHTRSRLSGKKELDLAAGARLRRNAAGLALLPSRQPEGILLITSTQSDHE